MGKTKDLGHLAHIVAYDAENHITVPAGITMHTNQLVASQAWVTTALGSYALSTSLGSYVPTSRTITINGTSYDLSANRSWDITSMIYPAAGIPLSTGSAWGTSITNNSANWNTAYGWGNHASAGYLTGINSSQVTTALGFTPVTNARTITINNTTFDLSANRSWTITATETDTLATVTSRGASTSTQVVFSGGMAAWNATTPGLNVGSIQIGAANGNANFGGAITFAARDGGGGSNAQAGIYVVSDGNYGTRMYFATTDAYITGSKTAMSISETGVVNFVRANATVQGNALIHAGNIGSQSVSYASSAGSASSSTSSVYTTPNYAGGVQGNPQVYFNNGIGLKVAMTGVINVWTDTVWINGYTGSDVPWMCAIHTIRNSQPRMWITSQTSTSTSYGTAYEFVTDWNVASKTAGNTNSISNSLGNTHDWTGMNYFVTNNGGQAVNNSNSAKLQAYSTGGNSAFMSFHRSGAFAVNMGLDDDNVFRIGGWSAGPNRLQLDMSGNLTIAGTGYFGITGAAGSLAYNASANNIYNSGWYRNYGDTGLYNQDVGSHFRRTSASHGTWEVFGYTKGGYVGVDIVDQGGYHNNLMYEYGTGGCYQENGGGWHYYYSRGNDCLGISGSDTYDWVRGCTNGKHRITNDTWCDATSWAYTFSNISDGRLKENITTVDSALDKVLQLRGVYYNWIIDTEQKVHIGLIAQETAAVCPEVVNYHDETDTYSVNYSELSGLFVESTKELNQKLIDANARIELLEAKINQLLNA